MSRLNSLNYDKLVVVLMVLLLLLWWWQIYLWNIETFSISLAKRKRKMGKKQAAAANIKCVWIVLSLNSTLLLLLLLSFESTWLYCITEKVFHSFSEVCLNYTMDFSLFLLYLRFQHIFSLGFSLCFSFLLLRCRFSFILDVILYTIWYVCLCIDLSLFKWCITILTFHILCAR